MFDLDSAESNMQMAHCFPFFDKGLSALLVQADLKEWEAAEAAKRALQKEIMEQLKADRAAQLAERNLVSSE